METQDNILKEIVVGILKLVGDASQCESQH